MTARRVRKVNTAGIINTIPGTGAGGYLGDSGPAGSAMLSSPGIAANAWATIQGSNLTSVTDTWDNFIVDGKLPTTVDGVTVTVGGQPA